VRGARKKTEPSPAGGGDRDYVLSRRVRRTYGRGVRFKRKKREGKKSESLESVGWAAF